jgi:hypothetical protein
VLVRYAVKGGWGSWLGSLAGLGDKRCHDAASELEATPNRLDFLYFHEGFWPVGRPMTVSDGFRIDFSPTDLMTRMGFNSISTFC